MNDIVDDLENCDGRVQELLLRAASEIRLLRSKLKEQDHGNTEQNLDHSGADRDQESR